MWETIAKYLSLLYYTGFFISFAYLFGVKLGDNFGILRQKNWITGRARPLGVLVFFSFLASVLWFITGPCYLLVRYKRRI